MRRESSPRALVTLDVTLEDLDGGINPRKREISHTLVPRNCSWVSEEPEVADTAEIEVSWGELALDPRAVRDIRVGIQCDDIDNPNGEIASAYRFTGFVDTQDVNLDESGETIRFSCRDYSGRLISTPAVPKSYPIDGSVRQFVKAVLAQLDFYAPVANQASIEDDTALKAYTGRSTFTPTSGASLWEVLNSGLRKTGQVCFFDPTGRLIIRRPREPQGSEAALMLYGDNVQELSLRKSYNPWRKQRIRLAGINPLTRKAFEVEYPTGANAPDSVLGFTVQSAASESVLLEQAKRIYAKYERRQIQGHVTTQSVYDRGEGDGRLMLAHRSGDAIDVRVRNVDAATIMGAGAEEVKAMLRTQGIDRATADVLVSAWINADDLAPTFYTRRATHTWDHQDGWTGRFDLGNFTAG
jgi:hypothetical protein